MNLPTNAFKAALRRGERQIGLWSNLCSNIAAEVIGDAGFDWILLDTEHAPNEAPGLLSQLQAMSRGTATPIVRPAWNDAVLIKRVLDIGALGILVPYVQDAAEAEQAVAAVRYPPRGVRGVAGAVRAARYGRVKDYLQHADEEICLLVQVETRSALHSLEEIAAVDGIDGVFIGPSDLAASFGHIGNPRQEDVQAAIRDAAERLAAAGTPSGILATAPDDAERYIDWGYRFVAVGSDLGLLARGANALARSFQR